MDYKREEIIKDLKENVIEVTFKKVSTGENRLMVCTLDPRYLPPGSNPVHLDEQHRLPENQEIVVAWDVQKGGWRSFRVDSVSYVQWSPGY